MSAGEETLSVRDAHLREAAHRMKNHLALIASMLRLQAGRIRPEDAPAQLTAMADRVTALARLYDHLAAAPDSVHLDLARYVEDLVANLRRSLQSSRPADVDLDIEASIVSANLAAEIGIILTELVTNAWKHGRDRDGALKLAIRFRSDGGMGELSCADGGAGMPADVRHDQRLGMKIIRALVSGIKGTMQVESDPGVRVIIRFPMA